MSDRSARPDLAVGFGKVDITPAIPSALALRDMNASRILDPLHAKALLFADEEGPQGLIVGLDLLWTSTELSDRWRGLLSRAVGLDQRFGPDVGKQRVLLAASHTHSSPETRLPPFCLHERPADPFYIAQLERALAEVACQAKSDIAPASYLCSTALSEAAIGRRQRILDRAALKRLQIKYDYRVAPSPRDRRAEPVTGIKILRSGKPTIAIVNFAAHPILTRLENIFTAEWPGRLAASLGLEDVVFLQGFAGDLLPNWYERRPLERQTPAAILRWLREQLDNPFATRRAKSLKDLEDYARTVVAPLHDWQPLSLERIDAADAVLTLPLDSKKRSPSSKDSNLASEEYGSYCSSDAATKIIANGIQIPVGVFSLGKLMLVWAGGEILSGFANRLRQRHANVLCVGYANGMLGYVPTTKELSEGGYEPWRSLPAFGIPKPLSTDADGIFFRGLEDCIHVASARASGENAPQHSIH